MGRVQLEKIHFNEGKSFKVFSPRLRNTFLWHYHPEIELVYVEADAGIRHVGTHISTYTHSDLILIGGNIPHLNFDYRLRSDYHQIVIQLRTDFTDTVLGIVPELRSIKRLFKVAERGISFHSETKVLVAERLKKLGKLNDIQQLLELIKIFEELSASNQKILLNNNSSSNNFILKDKVRIGAVYEYIAAEYNAKPDVNAIARKVNLTTPAFCRYFKQQTNMTFTDFVNQYRIERAKNLLLQNKNVTETCYAIGLDSLSYFNKLFKQIVGINPSEFRRTSVTNH